METDDKPEEKEKKEEPAPDLDTKQAQLQSCVEKLYDSIQRQNKKPSTDRRLTTGTTSSTRRTHYGHSGV